MGAALILFALTAMAAPARANAAETFVRPVRGITALRFGVTYVDAGGRTRRHHGIDIKAPEGTPVYASAAGKVAFSGNTPNGACVSIIHSGAIKTTYLPLKQLTVSKGNMVSAGSIIGYVGAASDPSGGAPHLHMGAIFAGEYLDPELLFRGDFKPDLSKLIRRGNIPPAGGAGFTLPPAAAAIINVPGFFAWLWNQIVSFFGSVLNGADNFWSWIGSIAVNSFSYLRGKIVNLGVKRFSPVAIIARFGFDRLISFGSGSVARLFDPSGDAGSPDNSVTIDLASLPARVEVFNSDGELVWVMEEWEVRKDKVVWTGIDIAGHIVPNGTYTVIVEYADGAEGFLTEVRWHQ